MRAYYSDHFTITLPASHRFPMEKYRLIREQLLATGTLVPSQLEEAIPIDRKALALVHTSEYLDAVFGGTLTDAEQRRVGFPWSNELLLRSRASVGGTVAAARWALVHQVAGNLAGGTHHAFADHGEGYCVFNDIAVAIRVLQAEGAIHRAAVVDLDVHQGNGTAAIFENDDTVFTFSIHGDHNFPFHKATSRRDVGLPDETGDELYLETLAHHLPEVLEAAHPEILFYQAGVDPLAQDTLGRLALTPSGLRDRDQLVLLSARQRGIPVVLTLGGGYAKPIELSVQAHMTTYQVAGEVFSFPSLRPSPRGRGEVSS